MKEIISIVKDFFTNIGIITETAEGIIDTMKTILGIGAFCLILDFADTVETCKTIAKSFVRITRKIERWLRFRGKW